MLVNIHTWILWVMFTLQGKSPYPTWRKGNIIFKSALKTGHVSIVFHLIWGLHDLHLTHVNINFLTTPKMECTQSMMIHWHMDNDGWWQIVIIDSWVCKYIIYIYITVLSHLLLLMLTNQQFHAMSHSFTSSFLPGLRCQGFRGSNSPNMCA